MNVHDESLAVLDHRVRQLVASEDLALDDLMRRMRGAFPPLVVSRLKHLGLACRVGRPWTPEPQAARDWRPELHPLDAEWYFTAADTGVLATVLERAGDDLLVLGAPSVAAALCTRGLRPTVVDSNPLVSWRFPVLSETELVHHDLVAEPCRLRSHAVTFFDAPWSLRPMLTWLAQAAAMTAPGGELMFVLYPELLRAAAAAERTTILRAAACVGDVSVTRDALRYEAPLFERRAIAATGVSAPADWRSGDLVRVIVRGPAPAPTFARPADVWETFVVGPQVVKLRRRTAPAPTTVGQLRGLPDDTLPSVRSSETPMHRIDLWTSRNRVASIGDRAAVARWLARASAVGGDPHSVGLPPSAVRRLRRLLELAN